MQVLRGRVMKKNIQKKSLISVIMPVYNAGDFLVEAIESILTQTYSNLEFVIVDDRSTDGSWATLQRYAKKDKRIRLYRNSKNLGVSETAKKAINHTSGNYIARMDADDVALPKRLSIQIKYLQRHSATVAIGGQCDVINQNGAVVGRKKFPTRFEDIYKYIFTFVPVQQPTLMMARNRLPKNFEFYRDGMNTAEEVELFFKLFQYGKVENVKETIHQYRIHNSNTSLMNAKTTFFLTLISRIKAVVRYDYKPTLKGVLFTFAQAVLVLVLPQSLLLLLYRRVRSMRMTTKKIVPNLQFEVRT